jgi:hypothetical protein
VLSTIKIIYISKKLQNKKKRLNQVFFKKKITKKNEKTAKNKIIKLTITIYTTYKYDLPMSDGLE